MRLLIIGATGLVGEKLIMLLEHSYFNIKTIEFVASEKSRGQIVKFKNEVYTVKLFEEVDLTNIDIVCITSNAEVSKKIVPILLKYNCTIIDNSSAYRKDCKLTVPKLNFNKYDTLFVNPNCCVLQTIVALSTIEKECNIKKIIFNTYQSLSGGGRELLELGIDNCIPEIGEINSDNTTSEEEKIIEETKKILSSSSVIYANCVRVPVKFGHLVNIIIEVDDCEENTILECLKTSTIYSDNYDAIDIVDNCNVYSFKLKQVEENVFSFYTYANNLLVGSSYNTFQIIELLNK